MRSDFDPDRLVSDWLDDIAPPRAPDGLLDQVLGTTGTARRRPSWVIPERWLPMALFLRPTTYARMAGVALLLILATLLAVAGVVGSQPDRRPAPPFGLARNGLIAFHHLGDIFVVNPDGTGRRSLTSGPAIDSGPVWSRDGTRIAYRSSDVENGPSRLIVNTTDGMSPTVVATDPAGVPWETTSWSPDGTRLAYCWDYEGSGRIFVAMADGSDSTQVGDPTLDVACDLVWSPDGSKIAFVVRASGPSDRALYVMNADGTNSHRLSQISAGSEYGFSQPGWQPGAGILSYAGPPSGSGNHEIWVFDPVDGSASDISNDPADEYWPSWSPDGSKVAFDREIAGVGPRLVIIDADGTDERVYSDVPIAGGIPTWSPDGTRLLVYREPLGDQDPSSAAIIDPTGVAPIISIDPFGGGDHTGSWQRLAP